MKKYIFGTVAFLLALPAIILIANGVTFAFIGSGFLPVGTGDMNAARGVITWLSAMAAIGALLGTIG